MTHERPEIEQWLADRGHEVIGVELEDHVKVQVWDSNSEIRFMVLPERPTGTEGMSEKDLAALVTRDSMIGTAKATAPK